MTPLNHFDWEFKGRRKILRYVPKKLVAVQGKKKKEAKSFATRLCFWALAFDAAYSKAGDDIF